MEAEKLRNPHPGVEGVSLPLAFRDPTLSVGWPFFSPFLSATYTDFYFTLCTGSHRNSFLHEAKGRLFLQHLHTLKRVKETAELLLSGAFEVGHQFASNKLIQILHRFACCSRRQVSQHCINSLFLGQLLGSKYPARRWRQS